MRWPAESSARPMPVRRPPRAHWAVCRIDRRQQVCLVPEDTTTAGRAHKLAHTSQIPVNIEAVLLLYGRKRELVHLGGAGRTAVVDELTTISESIA